MKFLLFALMFIVAMGSHLAFANEKPNSGQTNHAFVECFKSQSRQCWGAGRSTDCTPSDSGTYSAGSIDQNGYLAGAFGQCFEMNGHLGGCDDIREGLKFTMRCTRSYDNRKTYENHQTKIYVEVVNTGGVLTLNTHLDGGGGCNLPSPRMWVTSRLPIESGLLRDLTVIIAGKDNGLRMCGDMVCDVVSPHLEIDVRW